MTMHDMNRRTLDEYERQTEHLKIDFHDLEKCREREQQDHIINLENAKVLCNKQWYFCNFTLYVTPLISTVKVFTICLHKNSFIVKHACIYSTMLQGNK